MWDCPKWDCTLQSKPEEANRLGNGAQGIVYSTKAGEPPLVLKYSDDYNSLYREYEYAARAEGPYTVKVCGVCQNVHGPRNYLMGMQPLKYTVNMPKGGFAGGWILHPEDIMIFSRQMIDAINFIHSRGVVHRDIKVDNMMIDEDNHIKLVDFGLAMIRDEPDSRWVGSPGYTPPENHEIVERAFDRGGIETPWLSLEDSLSFTTNMIERLKTTYKDIRDSMSAFDLGRAQDLWSLGIVMLGYASNKDPEYFDEQWRKYIDIERFSWRDYDTLEPTELVSKVWKDIPYHMKNYEMMLRVLLDPHPMRRLANADKAIFSALGIHYNPVGDDDAPSKRRRHSSV